MKLWFVLKRCIEVPGSVTAATARLISQPSSAARRQTPRQECQPQASTCLNALPCLIKITRSHIPLCTVEVDESSTFLFILILMPPKQSDVRPLADNLARQYDPASTVPHKSDSRQSCC